MQRYEKYKDSGVDWIGEIPEGWEVRKLKNCLNSKLKYGANESGVEYNSSLPRYIRITDFGFDGKLSEDKKLSLTWKQGQDYLLKDGDILFARSGATVGKSYQFKTTMSFEKDYAFAGYLIKAEPCESIVMSDFLYFFTNSKIFDNWKSMIFNKATIENIGADKYSELRVIIPPILEQNLIIRFLDDKTSKIDQIIANKQKEIELLKERRQILIQKAVTKGLDDTAKMKDSGVDWIGEIPEHWEVRKLKSFCKAFGRIGFRGYTTADLVDEGDGAITISPSNIKESEMLFEKNSFLSWYKYNESPEIKIRENDILIVKTGSTYGKIGIVKKLPQKATINPQLLVLKDIKINSDYLYELLKSEFFQLQIEKNVIGSTIPTISETKILGFSVPIPTSEEEFDRVSKHIFEINEKFFTLISLKQQEIEKLKEYKTVLIDNLVTGKVRVS